MKMKEMLVLPVKQKGCTAMPRNSCKTYKMFGLIWRIIGAANRREKEMFMLGISMGQATKYVFIVPIQLTLERRHNKVCSFKVIFSLVVFHEFLSFIKHYQITFKMKPWIFYQLPKWLIQLEVFFKVREMKPILILTMQLRRKLATA